MNLNLKRIATVSTAIFIIDQLTKHWIVSHYALYEGFNVTTFFNIVRVHNEGAAFSFLAHAGGWQHYLFTALALSVSGYLLWLMQRSANDGRLCTAYGLVVCGALGNVTDRIRFGYVVDFLDVHLAGHHWPAFNVADSAICIGAALLIWDEISKIRAAKRPEITTDAKNKVKD